MVAVGVKVLLKAQKLLNKTLCTKYEALLKTRVPPEAFGVSQERLPAHGHQAHS